MEFLVGPPSTRRGMSDRIGIGHVEEDWGRTLPLMCEGQGKLRVLGEFGQSEVWSENWGLGGKKRKGKGRWKWKASPGLCRQYSIFGQCYYFLHRPALHTISPSLPSSPTALFHITRSSSLPQSVLRPSITTRSEW